MVPSNSDLHVPRKYGELILTKTHLICYTFTCCICESYWYLPWVDMYPPISEFISNRGPALYTFCKIKANKVCSPSSAVEDFVLQNCKAVRVIPHHTRTTNLWDLDWVVFKENIFEEHLDKENIIKHLFFLWCFATTTNILVPRQASQNLAKWYHRLRFQRFFSVQSEFENCTACFQLLGFQGKSGRWDGSYGRSGPQIHPGWVFLENKLNKNPKDILPTGKDPFQPVFFMHWLCSCA